MKKTIALIFLMGCPVFGQTIEPQTPKEKEPKFIVFANIGQSFRLAETPDGLTSEQRKYVKELKSGLSYDFSAYYVNKDKGYGLKYNVYRSSNERTSPIDFDPVISGSGSYSDDITITYIGPSFILTEGQNARLGEAFLEVSLGYMAYKNEATTSMERFTLKRATLGMFAGGGYHFRLNKQFLIGPQVTFVGGMLRKLDVEYSNGTSTTIKLDEEEYENLWRIDLSVSAKFRF